MSRQVRATPANEILVRQLMERQRCLRPSLRSGVGRVDHSYVRAYRSPLAVDEEVANCSHASLDMQIASPVRHSTFACNQETAAISLESVNPS